jgi:hypothetical protein
MNIYQQKQTDIYTFVVMSKSPPLFLTQELGAASHSGDDRHVQNPHLLSNLIIFPFRRS